MKYPFLKAGVAPDALEDQIRKSAIVTALDYINYSEEELDIYFKAELSSGDEDILNDVIDAHNGQPLPENVETHVIFKPKNTTSRGYLKIAPCESEGQSATVVSHNWGDKCSWYQGSIDVVKGVLELVSGTTYKYQDKTHWIDLENGRLYDEDNIMAKCNNKYRPKIYIADVLQNSEDYQIDPVAGTVTFTDAPEDEVTGSFSYADKSWFILKPNTGKILTIKTAEVQFSKDVIINSPIVFEPWYLDPSDNTMKPVPLAKIVYKNVSDFMASSNEGTVIPAWGGIEHDMIVLPYKYARPKPLPSSQNVEIRVYTREHVALTGVMSTATFYVVIDNES